MSFDLSATDESKTTAGVAALLQEYQFQLSEIERLAEDVRTFSGVVAELDTFLASAMGDENTPTDVDNQVNFESLKGFSYSSPK